LIREWIESLSASKPLATLVELQAANERRIAELREGKNTSSAITQLLSTTNGAILLATALNEQALHGNKQAIEAGASHTNSHIRDLFERFLPPERRVRRLGTSFEVASLLAKKGNADQGRQLFAKASGVTCRKCHMIDRQGGKIGPDLSGIGRKLRPSEILENIIAPSKRIDPKYANWIVATTLGTIDSGLLIQQSASQVVLRDVNGKDKTIPREDIELMRPLQKSIMPEMLLADFTADQAADLLAFLQTQKGDPSLGRKSHTIPHTSKPLRIDGRLNELAWKKAPSLGSFEFTWSNAGDGPKQPTQAKLLWDEKYLYAAFTCTDTNIQATRTERDSPVYRDDCVELFASPFVNDPKRYFNLEINALGTRLDKFRPNGVRLEQPWNPDGILIATSHNGTLNDDSDIDKSWTVEVAFPFAALGKTLLRPPRPGDKWRLNLHRLEDNMQVKSQWSRGDRNRPSFHTPEYFGVVIFGGPSKGK
jgi:putative heme-binding domain-containing protein